MTEVECSDWVMFSGITEVPIWKRLIPDDVTLVVVEVNPATHQENLQLRAKEEVNQPTSWDVISKDRAKLIKQAIQYKIAAFNSLILRLKIVLANCSYWPSQVVERLTISNVTSQT
jgi:hypothetical protein